MPNTRRNSNKLTSTVFARSKPYFRFYIGSTLNFFSRRIFQGVYNENAARAHLDAVQRLQPDESLGHSYLYRCLTVLDAKVQGLLTFDSILIAATTVILAALPSDITAGSTLIFIALMSSSFSSLLCLYAIWIYWADTHELRYAKICSLKLFKLRNRRTVAYRIAWLLAYASTVTLVIGIFAQRRMV